MVDFNPSIGKRVTVRIPDSPAVSLRQLSALPAPSDVTTPMPVTTTIGLPHLSDGADMVPPMLRRNSRDTVPSDRYPAQSLVLSMISGQTHRVCPEGNQVSTFPDHRPRDRAPTT